MCIRDRRGLQTSNLTTNFDQAYGGIYLAGAKDRMSFDLQANYATNNFDLAETAAGGASDDFLIGLDGKSFSTSTTALSGRFNYRLDVNAEKLISFIPTVGFNYFSNSGAIVQLNETQSLEVAASDTTVGFLGAWRAQSKVNPNGTSARTYYVTGT